MTNTIMSQHEQQIKTLLEANYPTQVKTGKGENYANLFWEDALWMPPDMPTATNRTAIAQNFNGIAQQFSISPKLSVLEMSPLADDLMYVLGRAEVTMTPKDGTPPNQVIFRVIWMVQQRAGEWKIYRQLYNSPDAG